MHLTLYLLNQGFPRELTKIEPNFGFSSIKTWAAAALRAAASSMLKPENRWIRTLFGQLFFDVPFSNDFQGFRIDLVPIFIAGRPRRQFSWNAGTNPALGAQVNYFYQNQYESGPFLGFRELILNNSFFQGFCRFRIGFVNFSSLGRPSAD